MKDSPSPGFLLHHCGWWWPDGLVPEPDQFADFAADVELPGAPSAAWMAVSCGTWYSLWANGELLRHGPPRETAPWQYYDMVDLARALRGGMNRIRIRAYHLGVNTQSHAACMAGLMVAGELAGDGWRIDPGRREFWRAAKSPAFLPGAARLFGCLGFGEHADLRENTDDWLHRSLDRLWKMPVIVAQHPLPGREKLIPSDLPQFSDQVREAKFLREAAGWRVWDFGGEVFGFLEVEIEADQPATCTLLHGESLTRAGLPDHRFCGGDFREVLEHPGGIRCWKAFEKRALRYLALPAGFRVRRLAIRESRWPLKEVWRELPGVEELSPCDIAIIKAAARSVALCCDDLLNDCPRRERAQYLDPADYMEAMPALFGTWEPIRRWFRQFARGADWDGVLRMCYPSPPGKPVIPDFSIGFVSCLRRYLAASGDVETARACFAPALASLASFDRHAGPDGLLRDVPGWVFLCNSFELAKHPRSAALNAIWSDGWRAAGELAGVLGEPGAGRFLQRSAEIRASWRDVFRRNDRVLDCDRSPEFDGKIWWNYHRDADRGRFADPGDPGRGFVVHIRFDGPVRSLEVSAPGRIRVWAEGRLVGDERNTTAWTHPHPFEPWTFDLPRPVTGLIIEAGDNDVDREIFLRASGAAPIEVRAGDLADAQSSGWDEAMRAASRPAALHPWTAPVFNQITAGYCAGMLEPDEARGLLRSCLRDEYHVPWMKRTTPLICTPTDDIALITRRVVLCNTPHSLSFFCRALDAHGMRNEAARLCRRLFGAMVEAGSDTLWEEFAPRSSLCHAWGAFCAEYLLPISPRHATAQ